MQWCDELGRFVGLKVVKKIVVPKILRRLVDYKTAK